MSRPFLHGILAGALALALATPADPQLEPAPGREDPLRRYRAAKEGANFDDWVTRLRDPRPEVRLAAVKSIAGSGDPQAARPLEEATLDPDDRVAALAIDSLGRMKATEATDFLAERLFVKGTSDPLRKKILSALTQIGDSRAIRPILDFVGQAGDPELRAAAIFALGEIGDTTVVDDVARIAERETDPGLKRLAKEAVEKISGRRFEPTPAPPGSTNPLLRPVEP
ncbi:MAG: HEAT repeat domain-containing protein [Candidatus Binatia bacterium]